MIYGVLAWILLRLFFHGYKHAVIVNEAFIITYSGV